MQLSCELWPQREGVPSCIGRGRSAVLGLASTGDEFFATLSRPIPCDTCRAHQPDSRRSSPIWQVGKQISRAAKVGFGLFPSSRAKNLGAAKSGKCGGYLYRGFWREVPLYLYLSLFFLLHELSTTCQRCQGSSIPVESRASSSQGLLGRSCQTWQISTVGVQIHEISSYISSDRACVVG